MRIFSRPKKNVFTIDCQILFFSLPLVCVLRVSDYEALLLRKNLLCFYCAGQWPDTRRIIECQASPEIEGSSSYYSSCSWHSFK